MVTKAQKKATQKYNKKNYDFVKLTLKKGEKTKLISLAESSNKSVSQYVRDMLLN